MQDDDYRQIVFEETGKVSLKDCDIFRLEKVLQRMTVLGFKPLPKAGKRPAALHPTARKARALWISLYHLGVVHNHSEQALEAMAKRALGCEKFAWANQSQGYLLIEALKQMAERNGWSQQPEPGCRKVSPLALQVRLCEAILLRLKRCGLAAQSWNLCTAAEWLGPVFLPPLFDVHASEAYIRLAAMLGEALRKFKGGCQDPQRPHPLRIHLQNMDN